MLVLSRKASERICIGDDITITVLKIRGNTIQLGIDAPREVSIRRSELDDKPADCQFPANEASGAELALVY